MHARLGSIIACLLVFLVPRGFVHAQTTRPLAQLNVDIPRVDSGLVVNTHDQPSVVFATVVDSAGAPWVRLTFDIVTLGQSADDGQPTMLRLTSLLDGATQHLTSNHLVQWRHTSAYFNGDRVLLEILAGPRAEASRVVVSSLIAGIPFEGGVATLCDEDDRAPFADPRIGRSEPASCTAWIIDDENHCFLTAGHCADETEVMEFNVPESTVDGELQHPGPEDQYAVDLASLQLSQGGVGNDWGYFGCFPNTETGLTPVEAQGDFFEIEFAPQIASRQELRVTGYGIDDTPLPWNQVQQTTTGSLVDVSSTTLFHTVDTMGGNSGSPIIDEQTGKAIGIHTHGGCGFTGGQNKGTAFTNSSLLDALENPLGICATVPLASFSFPEGLPESVNPDGGDMILVQVNPEAGTPLSGTGKFYYDSPTGFVHAYMVEVSTNLYVATLPALECGSELFYYFSVTDSTGEMTTDPIDAPDTSYSAFATLGLASLFDDDFEQDNGWTVEDSKSLTGGSWDRGIPVGGGDRGDPPTDSDGSGQCFLTENVDGDSDVDDGSTTLVSPMLDASIGDPWISYDRWFSTTSGGSPFQDIFVVDISNDNGKTWTNLETVGPDGLDVQGGWFTVSHRIADVVEPTHSMRLRFVASDTEGGSIVEAAVDAVRITPDQQGLLCVLLPGDVNGDGFVSQHDLAIVLGEWGPCEGGNEPRGKSDCPADLSGDGVVGPADLAIILGNWTSEP